MKFRFCLLSIREIVYKTNPSCFKYKLQTNLKTFILSRETFEMFSVFKNLKNTKWNVWVDAPTIVNQTEWRNHGQYWRASIDVNHCSPDGNGSKVRYADGTEFSVSEELIKEALDAIVAFIKSHFFITK